MFENFLNDMKQIELPNVFNPYKDICHQHDTIESPQIRSKNLTKLLEAATREKVETIWFGRDLGYLGGRRTGVAFTDEVHLNAHSRMYGDLELEKATKGSVVSERTANMVWDVIDTINRPIFLWNIFPLHPHENEKPFTNRCHRPEERRATAHIIGNLISIIRPKTLVAIGNDAAIGLTELGLYPEKVRHPSYGGKKDFINGIANLHDIDASRMSAPLLI
jgi:hypothetical protein